MEMKTADSGKISVYRVVNVIRVDIKDRKQRRDDHGIFTDNSRHPQQPK